MQISVLAASSSLIPLKRLKILFLTHFFKTKNSYGELAILFTTFGCGLLLAIFEERKCDFNIEFSKNVKGVG